MSAGNWFWIIYVIMLVFGGFVGFNNGLERKWWGLGFVGTVLVGLLGWGIFGPPIR